MKGFLIGIDKFNSLTERRNAQDKAYLERLNAIVSKAVARVKGVESDALALLAAFVSSHYDEEGGGYGQSAYAPKWGASPIARLLSSLGKAVDGHYSEILGGTLDAFGGEIQEVFLGACHELQYDLGGWRPISEMTEGQLSELANQKWFDGQRFSDRLWADKRALKRALYKTLSEGVAQGKGLKEMTEAFRKAIEANERVVERLIRTEYNRLVNQAILRAYKENGVEWYEYVAILDERTTETCESLNGKRFKVDSAEPGVNLPPMHPNCRSSTIPIGKSTTSIDKATERLDYEQWLKKYVGS